MDRLEQAQAAARRSAEIAAARRGKIPGWNPPAQSDNHHQRQRSREFASALGGYDAFLAVKAERLAAQAATPVDSPETAISDADSPKAHIPTI